MIQKDIVRKVEAAKFFNVLADETTDISSIQQLSICVGYINYTEFKIFENFFCLVFLTAATGEALANELILKLDSLGLKEADIRGQGYDGTTAISGKVSGIQARISNLNPKAVYAHVAHCLNLVITDSCNMKDIWNCMGTLEKVCVFFNYPKRQLVLEKMIGELCPDSKKQNLKEMCPTRWVQRHDSVIIFIELFDCVCAAITEVSSWEDKDASTDAN
ncbi:unnamed protein product [Ceutorhynchus assimilis]|uniref:DUF4371 domain-containing protein n=1 Tax=Ceutorhynchus assimilis TaxID=467358 RepID=A0A9N9ML37_9CUCU|nr:unnamed protein product [Ceutorhynchus assimilis]